MLENMFLAADNPRDSLEDKQQTLTDSVGGIYQIAFQIREIRATLFDVNMIGI